MLEQTFLNNNSSNFTILHFTILHCIITDKVTGEILQHSIYGDTSRDYRINELSEQYITNFKTHKIPTTYLVSIYRRGFFIGDFTFTTVK